MFGIFAVLHMKWVIYSRVSNNSAYVFFQFRATTIFFAFVDIFTFSFSGFFLSVLSQQHSKNLSTNQLTLKQNQNKSQKTRIFHLNFELFKNLEDVDSMDEELDSDLEQCLKDWTDLSNEYAVNSKIQFNF